MKNLSLFDFDKPSDKPKEKRSIVINSDIKLIDQDGLKVLIVSNYPIFTYSPSDVESERYLIAQLSRNNLATQKELAHYFNVNPKTVKNYKRRLLSQGLRGIHYEKPALDRPRKITPQVVREILAYYFKHSTASENEIARYVSHKLSISIDHRSVGRILEQCGFKVKGGKPLTEPFKGIIDERQLKFNFSPFATIAESVKPKEDPKSCTRADELYIKRLKKGFFSSYGTSFIYTPLISQFGLLEPYLSIYGIRDNKYISSAQVWLTFPSAPLRTCFHVVFLGFPSLESLNTAHKEDFGPLIGRNCLPSVRSLREALSDFSSKAKSEELVFRLCWEFIEHRLASLGVLYIDGHFLPYFGFELILRLRSGQVLKSWYSLRRFAIKGNIQYFANDRKQNPLCFIIRPPSVDSTSSLF